MKSSAIVDFLIKKYDINEGAELSGQSNKVAQNAGSNAPDMKMADLSDIKPTPAPPPKPPAPPKPVLTSPAQKPVPIGGKVM